MEKDMKRWKTKELILQDLNSIKREQSVQRSKSKSWQKEAVERLYQKTPKKSRETNNMNISRTSRQGKYTPKQVKSFVERNKKFEEQKNKKILEEQELIKFKEELEIMKIERERREFGKKISLEQKQEFINRMYEDIENWKWKIEHFSNEKKKIEEEEV